jgi:hypothetical protein
MRYQGGGVRHLATRQCNEVLLADKHTLVTGVQDIDETKCQDPSGDLLHDVCDSRYYGSMVQWFSGVSRRRQATRVQWYSGSMGCCGNGQQPGSV